MSQLDALLDAIGAAPVLPGARCAGRWHIWDNEHGDPELTEYAINQCGACLVLSRCETWYLGLPMRKSPAGVCAGRVNQPTRKAEAS